MYDRTSEVAELKLLLSNFVEIQSLLRELRFLQCLLLSFTPTSEWKSGAAAGSRSASTEPDLFRTDGRLPGSTGLSGHDMHALPE